MLPNPDYSFSSCCYFKEPQQWVDLFSSLPLSFWEVRLSAGGRHSTRQPPFRAQGLPPQLSGLRPPCCSYLHPALAWSSSSFAAPRDFPFGLLREVIFRYDHCLPPASLCLEKQRGGLSRTVQLAIWIRILEDTIFSLFKLALYPKASHWRDV